MIRLPLFAIACLTALSPTGARGEILHSDVDGFTVRVERQTPATAQAAFALFAVPSRWWSDVHTWSGDADAMRIDRLEAGGCWCELLPDLGSVEHGRILRWDPENGRVLMRAELGPLNALPVNGKLEWLAVAGPDGETRVAIRYDVSGRGLVDAAALAEAVDGVLAQQLDRLVAALGAGTTQ